MVDPTRKEANPSGEGDAAPERASIGVLFLAAAAALALVLMIVGIVAYAAMKPRSPALDAAGSEHRG